MVDAANRDNLDAAASELHQLMEKPQLQGIPVLVLGNKNDLPNALDHDGMRDRLNLESIHDRDVACYSISCKNKTNIDVVLQWLQQRAKKN